MGNVFDKIEGGNIFDRIEKKYKPEEFPQLKPRPNVEIAKEMLPIALDIAGGWLAPQLAIPHGAGTLATMGRRGLNLMSRMAGSAAGAGGGEYAQQALSGEDLDPREAGKQALIGAGAELGFAPFGALGAKLAKPLYHLGSKVTFLGNILSKTLSSKLVNKTVNRANQFLYDISPGSVKKQTVDFDDISVKLLAAKDEIGRLYDSYKQPLKELSKRGEFSPENTMGYIGFLKDQYRIKYNTLTEKQLVNRLISEEFGYAPSGPYGKQLKKIIEGGEPPTSDDFFWMLDHVFREKPKSGSSFLKVTPTQQMGRRSLKSAYTLDLDDAAGMQKGTADKVYMEYQDFLDIKKIYDRGMKDASLGEQVIDPYKLSKSIYMSKPNVLKIDEKRTAAGLEPYWPKLEEEAKFYADIVPYFKQAAENVGIRPGMMGTASAVARGMASGGSLYTAKSLMGPWGIPVIEGFGVVSAYGLLSPSGKKIIQNVVRETSKSAVKTGLHVGEKVINF